MGAALGDNDAADGTGAAGAGFPGAAEDLKVVLITARRAAAGFEGAE